MIPSSFTNDWVSASRVLSLCLGRAVPKEATLYVTPAHLFNLTPIVIVASLTLCLAAAGGFSRYRINLITDLIHPLMMVVVLMGLVHMLTDVADPAQIGPILSVTLSPTLWGLVVVAVLTPFARTPENLVNPLRFKLLGSVLLTLILASCVFMGPGVGSFINLEAASLVIGGVILFVLIDQVSGAGRSTSWAMRLLGIGAAGFTCGVLAALPHLTQPQGLGPATAVSLLSLLYSLLLLCAARLWLPERMLVSSGHLPTGFTALVLPVLFGISILFAFLAVAFTTMN